MANKVKALQQWCHQQVLGYRDVNVTNMTSSWKSGLAFCALIHKYRPDLIDYDSLSKENVYENNELAFRVAKEKLSIPDLLDAEDMVAMAVPDKLCIVTYVSQYYNVLRSLSPQGGPNVKKFPTKRPQTSEPSGGTEAKRITTEQIKVQDNQTRTTTATRGTHKQSMGDKCHICHQKVYLMERHLEGGKLYHRHCFRESQKSSFRAYRGVRNHESKENISPQTYTVNKPSSSTHQNGATSNGTAGAKSMARFWDTKIDESKRLPSSSSSNSSPSLSGLGSPRSQSPESKTKPLLSKLPEETKRTSKTFHDENVYKARTAKPWSPTMLQQPKASTYSGFEKRQPEVLSSPVSPVLPSRHMSPSPPPLSAGAGDLFPHYKASGTDRSIPSAPVETMEVDITSDEDSKLGAASVKRSGLKPSSLPPSQPNPALARTGQTRWSPVKSEMTSPVPPLATSSSSPPTISDTKVSPPGEATIVTGLLHSLSNIRQRHDFKRDLTTSYDTAGTHPQKPSSINKVQMSPPSPTKPDPPRSILKSGGAEVSSAIDELPGANLTRGPKPILKHKDSVSVAVCDAPKASDNLRLRSILKPGTDTESGSNSLDNSPRSILKRHDDSEEDSQIGSGHGILKSSEFSTASDSSHDSSSYGPKSILKTGMHDHDVSASQDESPRPGKSILKSRKHSGDSLFSSSGDELEELSPKPILKTSPRSEVVVSPTSDRKSILKTKGLSSQSPSNTRDSPKPILKSRESSPAPLASSPLKVAEPTKPILKKGVEMPTPTKSVLSQQAKSPSGPSLLRTNGSEEAGRPVSSFAAFKSTASKGYTSNLGLGEKSKTPAPISVQASASDRKTEQNGYTKPKAAPRLLDSKPSPTSGARSKPERLDTNTNQKFSAIANSAKADDGRPDWMREAEKRQAARGGKYLDPEKKYLESSTKSSTLVNPGRSFSPPITNGTGDKKKAGTIDRPNTFLRKTSPSEEPMEVDTRPEWQKEAEKRQAARKGFYPDPEKVPIRNKTPEPEKVLNSTKDTSPKVPERPLPSYRGQTVPSLVNKQLEKDHLKSDTLSGQLPAGAPPPKPLRSPVPQRGLRIIVDSKEAPDDVDKNVEEAERRRLASIRKHPSILQRNKKSPPPPRPDLPPQFGKKKITPDVEFSFDPIRGKKVRPGVTSPTGERIYAEVGPPSRRGPDGSDTTQKNRFSQRPLPPLPKGFVPSGDGTPTPKRKVQAEVHIATSALISRLEDLDVNLQALEQEGRLLEEKIRSESDDAMDEADLMIAWFELVNNKNELVRQESDLMYRQRQQDLESQHEELEYELRCLMDKPDSEKTPSDRIREEALLQELIETVVQRNIIVDSIEEDRIRYLEEDEEIAVMMHAKGLSLKDDTLLDGSPTKKKGKDKRKDDKKKKKNRRDVKSSFN